MFWSIWWLRFGRWMFIWVICLFDILWLLIVILLLIIWLCGKFCWIRMLNFVMRFVRIGLVSLWCVVVIFLGCCWCLLGLWFFMVWILLVWKCLVELMGWLLMYFWWKSLFYGLCCLLICIKWLWVKWVFLCCFGIERNYLRLVKGWFCLWRFLCNWIIMFWMCILFWMFVLKIDLVYFIVWFGFCIVKGSIFVLFVW